MPQINIPINYDHTLIADMAGLSGGFGIVYIDETTKGFTFQASKMDEVDAAITAYPKEWFTRYKRDKLEDLAEVRRVNELKGPMGIKLDDKTILRLSIKRADLEWHPEKTGVRWELHRGVFVWLNRTTIISMSDAAINHVEACFERVYEITTLINEVTFNESPEDADIEMTRVKEALDAIEITEGWPSYS